jgi:hypothetical protein
MSCVTNVGIVVTQMVYGRLKDAAADKEHSYYYVNQVSCVIAFCSLVLSVITHFYDVLCNKGILDMNVEQRN